MSQRCVAQRHQLLDRRIGGFDRFLIQAELGGIGSARVFRETRYERARFQSLAKVALFEQVQILRNEPEPRPQAERVVPLVVEPRQPIEHYIRMGTHRQPPERRSLCELVPVLLRGFHQPVVKTPVMLGVERVTSYGFKKHFKILRVSNFHRITCDLTSALSRRPRMFANSNQAHAGRLERLVRPRRQFARLAHTSHVASGLEFIENRCSLLLILLTREEAVFEQSL